MAATRTATSTPAGRLGLLEVGVEWNTQDVRFIKPLLSGVHRFGQGLPLRFGVFARMPGRPVVGGCFATNGVEPFGDPASRLEA